MARRTEGLALFGVSGLVPLVVNPGAEWGGVTPAALGDCYLVVAVLVALSALPLLFVPERKVAGGRPSFAPTALKTALLNERLWPTWLGIVALSAMVSVFLAFATVTARGRGIDNPTSVWLAYAGGEAAVRLGMGGLANRIGFAWLFVTALVCFVGASVS